MTVAFELCGLPKHNLAPTRNAGEIRFRTKGESPMRARHIICFVLASLAVNQTYATTIVTVVTENAIFVAADTKIQSGFNAPPTSANKEAGRKLYLMNDQVVVGTIGLIDQIISDKTGAVRFHYETSSFVAGIRRKLPQHASATTVANMIADKTRETINGLAPYVADGVLTQQRGPSGDLMQFIVAGYDNGHPTVLAVIVSCDWPKRKINNPTIVPVHPDISLNENGDLHVFGNRQDFILAKEFPSSPQAHAVAERYPSISIATQRMSLKQTIPEAKGIDIATDAVRLEAEFDQNNVGIPIDVVRMSLSTVPKVNRLER